MSATWRSIVRAALAFVAILALGGARPALAAPAASAEPATPEARELLVMLRLSADHYRPNASYGGAYGDQMTRNARRRLAQAIARQYGLVLVDNGWAMPLVGLDCYVMRVAEDRPVEEVVTQVSHDPRVAWSEPMRLYRTQGRYDRENDPLFPVQPAAQAWRLADLHRVATGRGVRVAVVDSQVEIAHPDLAGQILIDRDFVSDRPATAERHGTGVAGVIVAKAGNGMGIAGVAPGARLLALRACWQGRDGAPSAPTVCDTLSLAKAIHFAVDQRAEVINLSLTGPPDRLLAQLIAVATARGVSVVAAFDPSLPKGGFPASEPGVIAVAAESLSPSPPGVYSAPDRDVPTTQPGDKWNLVNGSSYAAAHVSGLIALVREGRPSGSKALLVAAQPTGGLVDAYATLLQASRGCGRSCSMVARNESAR